MPHGHTTAFYDAEVIEDGRVRREPGYLTDLWTNHAVQFLEQNKNKPFFLFLTHNGPYGLGGSLTRPARNRHAEYYADKSLPSFPRGPIHPWLLNNRQYMNNVEAMRRYAAELSGVDDGVGRVMSTLNELGLDERTLVVFVADQGWGGGQHGIWGMADHTRPLHAFDETMHIPLIVRHPGSIAAGAKCDSMVANYDLMPTLLAYLGFEMPRGGVPRSPGRNFARVLRGETIAWENEVFYEFENTRAIRTPEWKYVRRHPEGPNEMYDVTSDQEETQNLVTLPAHGETRERLSKRLEAFFDRYADPKYDLWHGGRSKVARLVPPG
jgi:arylsulfatase A-like enzyme